MATPTITAAQDGDKPYQESLAPGPADAAVFTALLHEVARKKAPRLFALVQEYAPGNEVRVAGYGLAYADRAEVNSLEGGLRLSAENAESARTMFEIDSWSTEVRQVHLVWLDQVNST